VDTYDPSPISCHYSVDAFACHTDAEYVTVLGECVPVTIAFIPDGCRVLFGVAVIANEYIAKVENNQFPLDYVIH
jgi:hypothetical protein